VKDLIVSKFEEGKSMKCLFLATLVTAVLVVVDVGSAASIDQDLVLYYAFDEGKGDTVKDLSGTGNDGTIHGAEWVDGRFGKALEFNGIDTYVDCGDSESLQIEKEITLAAWVNMAVLASQMHSDSRIVARENSGAGAPWASYGLTANGNATGFLAFEISADTNDVYPKQTTLLEAGVWYHVAGVYDGSTCDIYVDGVKEGSLPQTGNLVMNPDINTMVGADVNRNIEFFQGIIDEVVIYSRALSPEEIKTLGERPISETISVVELETKLATVWGGIKEAQK
jgi:hypothetical protein